MNRKTYVNFKVEKAHDDGSVTFRLTEKRVDRYGEVVLPEGAMLDNFKANPVILYAHGFHPTQRSIPIGRADPESITVTSKAVTARIIFDDDGSDPFATMIAGKVKKGFLNTGSIGFRSIERSDDPVMPKQTGVTHKIWELLEYSITPIPALPSAIALRDFDEIRSAVEDEFGNVDDFNECIDNYFNLNPSQKMSGEDFILKFQDILDRITALETEHKIDQDPEGDPGDVNDKSGQDDSAELLTVLVGFRDQAECALKSITETTEMGDDENGS